MNGSKRQATGRSEKAGKPLFRLENATLRIRDRHIHAGQQWAIIGPNGSGKCTLVRALCGLTPVVRSTVRRRGPSADRRRIGRMLEVIATTGTTLLYATHHRHELPCCISRVLVLDSRGKASVHASSTASGANRWDFN
jgi:ABC-type molybdenum transport system ATPase subunit/photorepair protein PhrA